MIPSSNIAHPMTIMTRAMTLIQLMLIPPGNAGKKAMPTAISNEPESPVSVKSAFNVTMEMMTNEVPATKRAIAIIQLSKSVGLISEQQRRTPKTMNTIALTIFEDFIIMNLPFYKPIYFIMLQY